MIEIEVSYCGNNIDECHSKLQKAASNVYRALNESGVEIKGGNAGIEFVFSFNGTKISSSDTVDEAYVKVTGSTKAELDAQLKAKHDEYVREEEEHKARIPELTEKYVEEAKGIIREDKEDFWEKVVPVRLGDLYHGMELGATLDILREWNTSRSTGACRTIIENQGHSGMSHSLVCRMVATFAKGSEEEVENLYNVLKS